jgi:hypothetical protein
MTYDLIGQRFGKLTVTALASSGGKRRRWKCTCDCGGESTPTTENLRAGKSQACGGCRPPSNSGFKHGAAANGRVQPTYKSWASMKYRVNHKPGYRGVEIEARWVNDFSAFIADMGERPKGTTLDRIDNDKGYSKQNCRWATPEQQTRNRRITKRFTIDGETLTAGEWAKLAGLTYEAAIHRLEKYGSLRLPNAV